MKDLYRILDLPTHADDEAIGAAIRNNQGPEARDAARVLLMPERRTVYDQVYATLHHVGALRRRMNLTQSEFWPRELHGYGQGQAPETQAPAAPRKVWPWVALAVAVGAALAAAYVLG